MEADCFQKVRGVAVEIRYEGHVGRGLSLKDLGKILLTVVANYFGPINRICLIKIC